MSLSAPAQSSAKEKTMGHTDFNGQSFDALDWAKAFCEVMPEADEELMLSWFANAIMCGYDEAQRKAQSSAEGELRDKMCCHLGFIHGATWAGRSLKSATKAANQRYPEAALAHPAAQPTAQTLKRLEKYSQKEDENIPNAAWLLERRQDAENEPPCFWAGDFMSWTADVNEAVRFSRQEDALRVFNARKGNTLGLWMIVEHIWLPDVGSTAQTREESLCVRCGQVEKHPFHDLGGHDFVAEAPDADATQDAKRAPGSGG
jgi:hypothetical protein